MGAPHSKRYYEAKQQNQNFDPSYKNEAIAKQEIKQQNHAYYSDNALPTGKDGLIDTSALITNAKNLDPARQEAQINFARSEYQRQNAWPTTIKGMQASGINPGVLFGGAGGSTQGSTNNAQANTSQKVSGALGKAQLDNIKSQTFLNKANAIAGLSNVAGNTFSNVAKGMKAPASIVKNTTNQFSRHYH